MVDRPDWTDDVNIALQTLNLLTGNVNLNENAIKGGTKKLLYQTLSTADEVTIYTVPAGKIFYFIYGNVVVDALTGGGSAVAYLLYRPPPYTTYVVLSIAGAYTNDVRQSNIAPATPIPFVEDDRFSLYVPTWSSDAAAFAFIWGVEVSASEAALELAWRARGIDMAVLYRYHPDLYWLLREHGVKGRYAPHDLAIKLDDQLHEEYVKRGIIERLPLTKEELKRMKKKK